MKKIKSLIFFLVSGFFLSINPVYSQSALLDSVKKAVAINLNAINSKYKNWRILSSNDLNYRYQIFDILTLQSASESISNGRIYYFSLLGDDQIGYFILLEENKPTIIDIEDLRSFKIVWDFMCRNKYTLEQMNSSIDFIIKNYGYILYLIGKD